MNQDEDGLADGVKGSEIDIGDPYLDAMLQKNIDHDVKEEREYAAVAIDTCGITADTISQHNSLCLEGTIVNQTVYVNGRPPEAPVEEQTEFGRESVLAALDTGTLTTMVKKGDVSVDEIRSLVEKGLINDRILYEIIGTLVIRGSDGGGSWPIAVNM